MVICGGIFLGGCKPPTAPLFIYGNVYSTPDQPTQFIAKPDWMSSTARFMSFNIPQSAPMGKVRINGYIPKEWLVDETLDPGVLGVLCPACNLGLFVQVAGKGNNRREDFNSDAFASKYAIELDFTTGQGRILFNESCVNAHLLGTDPGTGPNVTYCREAFRITSNIGENGTNGFRVSSVLGDGGGFQIFIILTGANSFSEYAPAPLNCKIDVGFHLYTDQGNLRAEFWEPFGAATDEFPATEVYWYDGLGSPAKTLLFRDAHPDGPSKLCDHEYHS